MFQLLFLGSLFSALLTIYILILKRDAIKTYADYLLSIFVVFLSWNVLIYLLLHYNLIHQVPYLFKTAAPLAFAIPALSYLYTRAVLYNETRFRIKDLFHYIPFVVIFFNYLPFYVLPIEEKEKIIQELGQLKTYEADKDNKLRILPKEKIKENITDTLDNLILHFTAKKVKVEIVIVVAVKE